MTRLAHLSDLHFGDAAPSLVERASAVIEGLDADALVVTGDLTQKGRRREFQAARAFLDSFAMPKVVAPGNHDTPFAHLLARTVKPFGRFEKRLGAPIAGLLALDGVWTRALNTARGVQARMDWSLGAANAKDVEQAVADLAMAPLGACRIVACHHPLHTPLNTPFPTRTRRGAEAVDRLARAEVDLVLTGHLHVAFAEALPADDGRTYAVGAATAFSSRTRGEPAGFNVLDIAPENMRVTSYAWDGADFAPANEWTLDRRVRRPES